MKFAAFLLAFGIILAGNARADWTMYQKDLANSGRTFETGYLPLQTANFSVNFGMNFQPLVSDLNSDGNSDIVLFFNNSLIILDKTLSIQNKSDVGTLLGQPALFDYDSDGEYNMIFNSKQGAYSYFFVYSMNGNRLKQEFNLTLPFDSNRSGIKCASINKTPYCIFKDRYNFVHIVDLLERSDSYYNTTGKFELRHSVPAIDDIDGDGNTEAVFWFNLDNAGGYGILVFDLNEKKPDKGFDSDGYVDNLFSPFIAVPGVENFENFALNGHPVIVDLNNDGKKEIAVTATYDDEININFNLDWATKIFILNSSGSQIISYCTGNILCNDGNSQAKKWRGSNPFAMDYNNDGKDEACAIIDSKGTSYNGMYLMCFNYSGLLYSSKISNSDDEEFAVTADFDSDGKPDVATPYSISQGNGTKIIEYSLGSQSPIAADIDRNGGIDILWTSPSKTRIFLDSKDYSNDLSVEYEDISFHRMNSTHYNLTFIANNLGDLNLDSSARAVNLQSAQEAVLNFSIKRNSSLELGAEMGFHENERVWIGVDNQNKINETNEFNNFAIRQFYDLPSAFFFIDSGNLFADAEIKKFLVANLKDAYYTDNTMEADLFIDVGKDSSANIRNNGKFGFGFDRPYVEYFGQIGINPYSGVVGSYADSLWTGDEKRVMIVGNSIEGLIASVRHFAENQGEYINTEDSFFIDDNNEDGLKIYDYMHNNANAEHYMKSTPDFGKIAANALNGTMVIEKEYNFTTNDNDVLRIRNLKADLSSNYLEYLGANLTIAMSGGLWADITSWQQLGLELASDGEDVWLVEITGGPYLECPSCYDYYYSDLTDEFWPGLIGSVQKISGKTDLVYVGHSNGCRTALDSLSKWSSSGKQNVGTVRVNGDDLDVSMSSNPVKTMIGVACPGAFSELSYFAKLVNESGDIAIARLEEDGKTHVKFGDVGHELESGSGELAGLSRFFTESKISLNLFKNYKDWISSNNDLQPGNDLYLDKFFLIYGNNGFFSTQNDEIVSVRDELEIYDLIQSSNKSKILVKKKHTGMTTDKDINKKIKEYLGD